MIYSRPIHGQRPVTRVLAGLLCAAMLFLAFLGYPPKLTAQTVELKDPAGLPALDGTTATGRATPTPLAITIDGSFPVAATTTPTLEWPEVPANVGQVQFVITTLAEKAPKELWSRTVAVGPDRIARVTVPAGIVAQGHTYAWAAQSTTNAAIKHGPFSLTIDLERSGSQPIFDAGNFAIAKGTGDAIYTYQGAQLSTLGGGTGWTLIHRSANTPQKGLPAGWKLVVSGSTGWDAIRLNGDGTVTLSTSTGVSVTYAKRGDNQWQPQVGRYNSAGEATLLNQNADGTFSATDGNRAVTVFSKPTLNADGHPVRVWAMDTPAMQQHWVDGKLNDLTDPVTQNQLVFLYSGDQGCAEEVDPGFIKAPAGMLCGTLDWTGNAILLEYVDTPTGPQIGRIVSGLGMGPYAQSTDIGWDHSGRIVEMRTPLAAFATASGKVGGLTAQDPRALTQVTYDANGRVASLTNPAGLISEQHQPAAREQRSTVTFTYAPFTVRTKGTTTPAGFDSREWLDPVTLQLVKQEDESGNVVTTEYDQNGNPTKVVDHMSGTTTETIYNKAGKPIAQLGPTKGSLTSPTAPKTVTAYDQDENGRDWKGLAALYWSNSGFNGAPTTSSTGPKINDTPVQALSFNWPSNPAGSTGPWSARLTGTYLAPKDGSYTFRNDTTAKLWVGGSICSPTCTKTLAANTEVSLQIDAVNTDGTSITGVKALVTEPNGTPVPIPIAQLRPNYGLATSSSVRENDGTGVRMLTSKMVYDTTTTQLLKTISPSGATISRTYEPYNPAQGQWGRSTSVTNAADQTTTSAFYKPGETATDCSGNEIAQDGRQKSVTLPSGQVVTETHTASGAAIKASDGVATTCGTSRDGDIGFTTTTTGLGEAVSTTAVPMIANDPLASGSAVQTQGATSVEYTRYDINGNPWETVDSEGTKIIRHWNQVNGNLDSFTETTKHGESRTTEYAYTSAGQITTVTVNGHLLITNDYAPNGTLLRSTLGNGAVQTFELDQNNNGKRTTTHFPNGTSLVETMEHSPSGRLLSRTLTGPTGTATYTYTYNEDGRLIDTQLSGTTPVKETRWQSAYTGLTGANGNRASQTTTLADGTQSTTEYTYGENNRPLTATNSRGTTAIEYDAAGRATKVGATSLAYDAAGGLLSATDGTRTYAFSSDGNTTTFTKIVDGATRTVTATATGESLILGADQRIDGQLVSPAQGVNVLLGKDGAPTRWIYDDTIGNAAWTSTGTGAPAKTHLYSPDGKNVSVERTFDPKTPLDLVVNGLGWMDGGSVSRLRLATPVDIIGARTYSQDFGRWVQADPTIGGSMNAYEYATGDPINQIDPTGNTPWGWIAGAITATVVGVLIGALTFGIGTGGAIGYGYAALALQIAGGAVAGAISGFAGEVVTQLVEHKAVIDWSSVGIAAGIGAAAGALSAGGSAYYFKLHRPAVNLRCLVAENPLQTTGLRGLLGTSRMGAYNKMWTNYVDDLKLQGQTPPSRLASWNNRTTRNQRLAKGDAKIAEGKKTNFKEFTDLNGARYRQRLTLGDDDLITAFNKGEGGVDAFLDKLAAGQQKALAGGVISRQQSYESAKSIGNALGKPNQSLKESIREFSEQSSGRLTDRVSNSLYEQQKRLYSDYSSRASDLIKRSSSQNDDLFKKYVQQMFD